MFVRPDVGTSSRSNGPTSGRLNIYVPMSGNMDVRTSRRLIRTGCPDVQTYGHLDVPAANSVFFAAAAAAAGVLGHINVTQDRRGPRRSGDHACKKRKELERYAQGA